MSQIWHLRDSNTSLPVPIPNWVQVPAFGAHFSFLKAFDFLLKQLKLPTLTPHKESAQSLKVLNNRKKGLLFCFAELALF